MNDSFFSVHFRDGTEKNEASSRWADFSEMKIVDYFGKKKQVFLSKIPIDKIYVRHKNLEIDLKVPEDCEVYQAIRAEIIFQQDGKKFERILGRCVGLVKNGAVIEERFINVLQNEVNGLRS